MISNSQAGTVKSKSTKETSSIVNGNNKKKGGEQKGSSMINNNNNNNTTGSKSDNNNKNCQSKIPVYNRNQSFMNVDNFVGWQNQLKTIHNNIGDLKIMDLPEHVRIHQNIHNRLNHSCHNNRAKELPRSLPSTPGSFATKMTDESGSSTVSSSNYYRKQSRQKRNIYEKYLPLCEMQKGLQKGEIVEGILRVNQRNYNDSYISAPDGGLDIFISGLIDRNKALNGDLVAVQLFEEDKWMISYTAINSNWNDWKEDFEQFTLTNIVIDFKKLSLNSKDTNLIYLRLHSSNDCKSSIAELLQNEFPNLPIGLFAIGVSELKQKIPYWTKFIQRMGKVVSIIDENHPRVFAGTLKFMEDMSKKNMMKKKYLMFTCCDQRNPQIVLPVNCLTEKVFHNIENYKNHLFLAKITEWESDSLYPKGEIIKNFGKCGNIETETEVMLISLDIKKEDFPEAALQEYKKIFPGENWSIPEKEYAARKDLRQQCIFTIDPETAKDLDDAISYRELPDGQIEIGVHIADVSYFIKEDSLLDQIAKERATSVYLVSEVIPMLPHIFCQDLCSLNPGEDKLTFSVIFKFDRQGNILNKWFGRTIINSCCKLAYEHAQNFIESKNSSSSSSDWDAEKFPEIFGKWSLSDICDKVKALHHITQILKVRRFENGSLRLDKKKISFVLNEEGMPIALANYATKDSNHLIEELMLLANKSVAELLYDKFAEQGRAFLRGHPPLSTQNLNDFIKYIKDVANIDFNTESSASVKQSLELLKQTTTENVFQMATLYLIKSMLLASYKAVDAKDDPQKYHHYALNFAKYTHFTSPIRRYADVIVHRLLSSALQYDTICSQSSCELKRIAQNCNTKKYNAYCASERSAKIYLKAYISKLGHCLCKAIVHQVLDRSFDVLVLDFNIIERIYLDQHLLDNFEFVKTVNGTELKLNWTNVDNCTDEKELQQTIKNFDEVDIEITVTDKFEFKILIAHPNGQFIPKNQ